MNKVSNIINKRAGIIGIGTLFSRILGVIRESVIAAYFPKEAIDAYQVAFMIPNSFRRLTAEGSFSISLTSVFSKLWEDNDLKKSQEFTAAVYGFSLIFLLILTLSGVFGAKWLTMAAGKGFLADPEKFNMAVSLTAMMFPYIFFISLCAVSMGLLNSAGRFFTPAFAPVLLNVSVIGCAVGLTGILPQLGINPIFALAYGVIIGGIAQLLVQLPSLYKVGLLVWPKINMKNPALRRVLKLTAPMIIGAAAYQFFNFIATAMASTLYEGAVTYITFAARFFELPLAVLVMAISTASLPSLSGLIGKGEIKEAKQVWMNTLKLAQFVSIPAMIALIILAEPIISIMYQRGLFSYHDTIETAGALKWLAAGICSVALLRQTSPFFYALEKVKIPVIMTFVMIGIYILSAFFLKESFGHRGLCMAITIATTIQGLGLLLMLRIMIGPMGITKLSISMAKTLVACMPMGIALFYIQKFGTWDKGGNNLTNILTLSLCVIVGMLLFAATAKLIKSDELNYMQKAIIKKRKNK